VVLVWKVAALASWLNDQLVLCALLDLCSRSRSLDVVALAARRGLGLEETKESRCRALLLGKHDGYISREERDKSSKEVDS
jgi:hypothetical protein